jgi:cation:H+ antiporter
MWLPVRTMDTKMEPNTKTTKKIRLSNPLWLKFAFYSAIVAVAGWSMSISGIAISHHTGMSEGIVGGVFVAISTSLPELVIAITAVRLKSLTLAVGDIVGGNIFDTLFIAFSDIAYRKGSIFAHISQTEQLWLAVTVLMTGVILMGLLYRERRGIANIGWESATLVIIYVIGLGVIVSGVTR